MRQKNDEYEENDEVRMQLKSLKFKKNIYKYMQSIPMYDTIFMM